jgi:hypothetical protein
MKQISLKKIISIAMKAVASFGIKESVLRHYRQVYDKLSRYFLEQSRMMYSVQLAESFVKECKQQLENGICSLGRFKQTRRAVQLLKDYYYTGSIVWKQYSYGKKKAPENPAFVKLQENYISYLVNLGWKQNSIESADNYSRQFLLFIEGKGRRSVAKVKPIDVSQFFSQLIDRYQAKNLFFEPSRPDAQESVLSFLPLPKRKVKPFLLHSKRMDLVHNETAQSFCWH